MALVDAELVAYRSTKRTLIHGNRQFSHEKYDYPGTHVNAARNFPRRGDYSSDGDRRNPNARVRDWLNKLAVAGATRVLGKST